MARTKQTVPLRKKGPVTWTRFRLPPSQEWPNWPCLGATAATDSHAGSENNDDHVPAVDPLQGVAGASCSTMTLGRMVESPQEAVCMIQWQYMDDINNFLASPACDHFLRVLGHLHDDEDEQREEDDAGKGKGDDTSTSEAELISRRRPHFLILKHWSEGAKSPIQGRVTLTTFVIPEDDGYHGLLEAYRQMKETFGRADRPTSPDPDWTEGSISGRSRVWFYSRMTLRTGEVEEGGGDLSETWVEKTFGRGESGGDDRDGQLQPQPPPVQSPESVSDSDSESGDGGSDDGPAKKALFCQFRIWNDFRDENVGIRWEEENSQDPEVKEIWDRYIGEWMSDGRILAWKRERWDFEPVMWFRERYREKKRKREEEASVDADAEAGANA